jgi:thiamine-monophosphate kinase
MMPARRRIGDLGEHRWLRGLLGGLASIGRTTGVLIGPGDDAAVLRPESRPWVVTTDAQRAGVHFRVGWLSWRDVGRRTFRVTASDLAAMGAIPRAALLALEVPRRFEVRALTAFVRGFAAEGRRRGAPLVGGDVSAGPCFGATATVLGVLRGRAVTRAGAQPGDAVFVTGRLGAAAWAVRQRRAGRRVRLPLPPVRLDVGVELAPVASAMLDVSDGLLQDMAQLCRASRVGAVLELDRVPVAPACSRLGRPGRVLAATGGEDYELLFTVPRARLRRLGRVRLGCAITRIGTIVSGGGVVLVDGEGRHVAWRRAGFDHFR